MRYSRQREEILKVVKSTDSHPTADWIYDVVRKVQPNISLGTVYRNLGQLVEKNMIYPINVEGVMHYDRTVDKHQHFYCDQCKTLYDVNLPSEDFIEKLEETINHTIVGYNLHLNGICHKCQITAN